MPEETAGPFPGDGYNSVSGSVANALALSGIVRSDIRSSIAGASSRWATATRPRAPAWPATPSTSGIAAARAATRCTRPASPPRTTCAVCRRPTTAVRSRSRPSSPAATRAGSVANLNAVSFATDGIFSDGVSLQTASLAGSVAAGYTGSLTVAIAA